MMIENIRNIVVIGSGTMGPGIAQSFAKGGYSVRLCDKRAQALKTGTNIIRESLRMLTDHNLLQKSETADIEARITYGESYEDAVASADLIIECITEDRGVKKRLFDHLDEICPPHTLILSNTSYLNIYELIRESRQHTAIIAHWFAPPQIIPLVEVVKGPLTSEHTVKTVVAVLKHMGKLPVVMEKYVPGFAVNRIQRIIGREVFFLLDNGYISAEELDLAIKSSIAPRMMVLGAVQRYDFTGLDLSVKNLENSTYMEAPMDNQPKCLFDLVREGHLGVKTGKGFYDYGKRPLEEVLLERDAKLLKVLECLESIDSKLEND